MSDLSGSALTLAASIGATCLTLQALLTLLLTRVPGFWQKQPEYVAHQAIHIWVMAYFSCAGTVDWFSSPRPDSAHARIFGHDAAGAHLATVMLGVQSLWDLPVSSFASGVNFTIRIRRESRGPSTAIPPANVLRIF